MNFSILLLLACVNSLSILPYAETIDHGSLYNILSDISDKIHVVQSMSELTPRKLRQYSILKVNETNSVILNELLAQKLDNPGTSVILSPENPRFVEISYNDSYVTQEDGLWAPLGPCHSNARSETKTEISRSWTVSGGGSVSASLSISQIFGVSPSYQIASNWGSSISGTVSCVVGPRESLQFMLHVNSLLIRGVKRRIINLPSRFRLSRSLSFGEWEEVATITKLKKKVRAACVTDPNYLQCN
ncbi:hypothetical protein JA9_001861 [Meyerozyma sp. JA9]|nr:hypothetical protein JA9_001861 [Meyerozyma sp. JA9]